MEPDESAALRIHGTLVQVGDVGVLLVGRSGIGKVLIGQQQEGINEIVGRLGALQCVRIALPFEMS